MGDVISLAARREPDARGTARDGAAVRARLAGCVTAAGGRAELARVLTSRLGRLVRPSHVAAWMTTVTPPADVVAAAQAVTRAPRRAGDGHSAFLAAFRAADRRSGGRRVYSTVIEYLASDVAPALFTDHGRDVFTAAAGIGELAAWAAHDAGDDTAAGRHFARSLDMVRLGDDRQLQVHILASSAHLAYHRGDTAAGDGWTRQGWALLDGGPRIPELEGRLWAMQARGHAAAGRTVDCARALAAAEAALGARPGVDRSPWVSHFDEASLAVEAARCSTRLGDLPRALRHAERVIALRTGDRARSRAFGQLLAAGALVGQGRPDEACGVVQQVMDGTAHHGSALVVQQILDVRARLRPYRQARAVGGFLACLDVSLQDRGFIDGSRSR